MVQRASFRTDQEWMDLIRECRTSGLTDKDWCEQHHLQRSSLYYHIQRLRKKSCEIPASAHVDRKPVQHAVVPLIVQDNASFHAPVQCLPDQTGAAHEIDSPRPAAVRIRCRELQIELLDGADSRVVRDTLSVLYSLC